MMRHEILNEKEKIKVFTDVLDFLKSKLRFLSMN